MNSAAPLIVTLSLDEQSFSFFNALRKAHFPAARNFLQAHLTLFHHLPPDEPAILETIERTAARYSLLPLAVTKMAFIGNGVAYALENKELMELHVALQAAWKDWLIPQDKQRLWPHVTIQNKVPATVAKALYEELTLSFEPFTAIGTGLSVWVYKNGPWEALKTFPFLNKDNASG